MIVKPACLVFYFLLHLAVSAQDNDSLDNERLSRMISLSEVVMRTDLNVPAFIKRVKEDTTFFKAFRNLHVLSYTSRNDVRMLNRSGKEIASLQSITRQVREDNCRTMEVLEEKATDNFYDKNGDYNFFTARMYAGLFFTKGKICNETNIVKGVDFSLKSKRGIEKNKEQLKMMFFNPGKKVPGIPLMGDKLDIFDPERAKYYDFNIDHTQYNGQPCYVFSMKAKEDLGNDADKIVIDRMTTWFHATTMEVLARNYNMSYSAGVYYFNVHIEVTMTRIGKLLVPSLLRYSGEWNMLFKKRERAYFTATLSDFSS